MPSVVRVCVNAIRRVRRWRPRKRHAVGVGTTATGTAFVAKPFIAIGGPVCFLLFLWAGPGSNRNRIILDEPFMEQATQQYLPQPGYLSPKIGVSIFSNQFGPYTHSVYAGHSIFNRTPVEVSEPSGLTLFGAALALWFLIMNRKKFYA